MEENGSKGNSGSFWVGMLIGAVVGAGVSLLYAPKSGAETRAMIKERAKDISQKTSDTFNRAKSKISEMRGKAEEKAQELKSKAESMRS